MASKTKKTKKEIGSSQAAIISALIGLAGVLLAAGLGYLGTVTLVYGPMHATQTAQAYQMTQTALSFQPGSLVSNTPMFTPTFTATETSIPNPTLALNVLAPTDNDLKIVPILYVKYADIKTPNTEAYKVNVESKLTYLWNYKWCAKREGTLSENLYQMDFSFFIDDVQIPEEKILVVKEPSVDGWPCQRWTTMLSGWDAAHFPILSVVYHISKPLSDGVLTYPIGEYRHQISVTVIE